MSVGSDDKFKRQGVASKMLRHAVEKLGPVKTSRVFSEQGRKLFNGLVEKGHADRIADDDYLIHF